MSEPKIVVVPKDLYYHEVEYVRGLEKALTAAKEKLKAFYRECPDQAYSSGMEYGMLMKMINEALNA